MVTSPKIPETIFLNIYNWIFETLQFKHKSGSGGH